MSKKVVVIIVVCVLGLTILGAGGYVLARYFIHRNDEKKANEVAENNSSDKAKEEATTEESPTDSSENPGNTNIDWPTYKNYELSYMINYPKEAKVEDMGDPKASDLKNSKCLKISTDNYYVLVGKVPTENDASACFRTGVGSDWTNGPTDTVTAAGVNYTPNGMHTEAASAGYYYDFFLISPADENVKIEYGTSVNEKYGTMSKATAKDLVHQIVATYNPAE
ncbi:MAG: hypothetical protein Athens101428_481 [Candidatus Berkelbacteria bacterium Athens1014_28]|uniref:Uncharacterized protein n=1 Tax=Candidatus Berkelbacteria bacterium Athens1014_28 TaxID=2017145 RepID=A0A554LM84_9BACT|nr:MAG: hypothetical protein Athens101428_481 [Candidatus Berkelbacteria bacterium Athens1014_28]